MEEKKLASNKDGVVWFADPNTAETIKRAYQHAIDYRDSGICMDGSLVTTIECVAYQIRKKQLIMSFRKVGYNVDITYHKYE